MERIPLEFDWLIRVMPREDSILGSHMKVFNVLGDAVRIVGYACPGPQCWKWSIWIGSYCVNNDPTRDDVRKLFEVIGSKLNESI